MKFSIVMPVLNGAEFVSAAIESVAAQTEDAWELIIVDGGSRDETPSIAARHARDPRIHFVSEPDDGMYDALLKGFARSRGDWLCWLNSDDLLTPWALATGRHYFESRDCDWITGAPGSWDASGRLRSVRPAGRYDQRKIAAGWHHDGLLGFLQQESMFFSRRLFDKLTPAEIAEIRKLKFAGDFLLWRRLAQHAPLQAIPSVLGGFRRHRANMSASNAAAYRAEVSSTNPFTLPAFIAAPLALAWRVRSAWALVKLADHAERELLSEATNSNGP